MRVAVIGSGPTGAACARALIRRGLVPTMIDVGETLAADRRTVVDRMSTVPPIQWSREDREFISANPTVSGGGIPKKLVFGSDFHFARDRAFSPTSAEDGTPCPTFAQGGFSLAWGGAILPTHDCDLDGWPVRWSNLEPSYRRVLKDMPLSAAHDSLEAAFPILKESFSPLPISEDLKGLLADLNGIASCDDEAPFLCGRARLAVDASKCRSCGLCLTGCVYGAIHSFSPEIESLDRTGALRYLSGRAVQTLAEDRTGVRVRIQRIHDSEMEEEHFDRVFLAAGAIQSTRVILTSLKRFNEPVSMKDSQKFVLPLLRTRRFPMAWPNTVSLPGLFVEFKVPDVSRHWVHAQVSTVNDYVLQRLGISSRTGALRRKVSAPLYERLLVAWCGIHSDHSSGIELKLSSRRRDDLPVLELRPRLSAEARPTVRRVARYFARHLRRAGTFAMTPALTFAAPGGGSHFGGTLPMSANPRRRLETDTLGRLPEWGRIHVVDGSILPTVPATTVALLQMANADRIASCVEMS